MGNMYNIQFPTSMEKQDRIKIINAFENDGWETYLNMEHNSFGTEINVPNFEVFWFDSDEPAFPTICDKCIITKK